MITIHPPNIPDAAHALMAWLSQNVGDTADWPCQLVVDTPKDADAIAALMNDLEVALKMGGRWRSGNRSENHE